MCLKRLRERTKEENGDNSQEGEVAGKPHKEEELLQQQPQEGQVNLNLVEEKKCLKLPFPGALKQESAAERFTFDRRHRKQQSLFGFWTFRNRLLLAKVRTPPKNNS